MQLRSTKSWYNFLVRFSYKSCQENFRHVEGKKKLEKKTITTLMEHKRKNKKNCHVFYGHNVLLFMHNLRI